MPLKSIQLAAINPIDRAAGKYEVVVHSDEGDQLAMFDCPSEHDAVQLRNAVRQHADRLRSVGDYRDRPRRAAKGSWEAIFGHLGTPDEAGNQWHRITEQRDALLAALIEMRAAYGNCGSPRQQQAADAADAAIAQVQR
jgi:hypothetical protein